MTSNLPLACSAVAALGVTASAQVLMIPDWTTDAIMLYSPIDGSQVNASFIPDGGGTLYDFSSPKEAFQVNNEIWVIDQITDQVVRFDSNGTHLATILPAAIMVDNMRGACFANNTVYVSTDGTGNGSSNDTVVMLDLTGARIGSFSTTPSASTPFDLVEYNGELLLSNFVASNTIGRYSYGGTYLGAFHVSAGVTDVDSPEQLTVAPNNDVLAAGFGTPYGVYRYDSAGTLVNSYLGGSNLRGCYELSNGNILFTDGAGVKIFDVGTSTVSTVTAGTGFQYINELTTGCDGSVVDTCEPTAPDQTDGCTPDVDWAGTPDVTECNTVGASDFVVTWNDMSENKNCNVVLGKGAPVAIAWSAESTRCFPALYARTGAQDTGDVNGAATCGGEVSLDVEAYLQGGGVLSPVAAGDAFVVQVWYRDPASSKSTQMSDAAHFTVCP